VIRFPEFLSLGTASEQHQHDPFAMSSFVPVFYFSDAVRNMWSSFEQGRKIDDATSEAAPRPWTPLTKDKETRLL